MVPSLAFAVLVASSYASTWDAPVARVVDGDSLIVLADCQEFRVRLKEIDAPELKQSFGKRSRHSLADMCARHVRHETSAGGLDREGPQWTASSARLVQRDRRECRAGAPGNGVGFRSLRQGPQLVPATRAGASTAARLVGGCPADAAVGMAGGEGGTGIQGRGSS
jgi:hypothetical protein